MKVKNILSIFLAGFLICSDCSTTWAMEEWTEDSPKQDQTVVFESEQATSSNAEKATSSNAVLEKGRDELKEQCLYYKTTVNQVTITLEAEPGVLPAGTVVKVKPIEKEADMSVESIVENSGIYEGKTIDEVMAFDISLWCEHEEIEPEQGTVMVTFWTEALKDKENFESNVFHIEDGTQEVTCVEHKKDTYGKITFEADSFSIYGIAMLAKDNSYWNIVKNAEIYKASGTGTSSGQLNDQEEKINVLLFGRMGRCVNTMNAAESLETLMSDEAAEKVNVYLLDVDSTWDSIIEANANLNPKWNYVVVCGDPQNQAMGNQGYYENYMWSLLYKDLVMGSVTFPAVYIFDSEQEKVYSHTGSISQSELAEALLLADSDLLLKDYVSVEDILQVNQELYDKNRKDQEALDYYRFYDKKIGNHLSVYNKAVEITENCKSDEARVKAIHDWVADYVYYDYDSYNIGGGGVQDPGEILTMTPMRSVCQGYANLTEALCRAVGIPCKTVNGYALGLSANPYWTSDILNSDETNHAWNEVYLNGKWTILDTTWDSRNTYENGQAITKVKRDKYYNISLKEFSNDHKIVVDEAFGVPPIITGLNVTDNIGSIKLSWDTEENRFEDFNWCEFLVYRKAGQADYERIGTTYSQNYTDKDASVDINYKYKVTILADNGYETRGIELSNATELLDLSITISVNGNGILYVGQVKEMNIVYHGYVGQTPAVNWSSDNPSVVKIDADGNITGIAPGSTYIRANVGSQVGAMCYVTVEKLYEISNLQVTDNYADFLCLEWESRTANSVIERKEVGTDQYEVLSRNVEKSYIDSTVKAGHTYTYHIYNESWGQNTSGITLNVAVSSAKITLPLNLAIKAGDNKTLVVLYENFDSQTPEVTFKSSNPAVATVDQSGNIKAVGEGKTDIILSVNNSKYQASTEVYCAAENFENAYTAYEKSVLELVNKERISMGLTPLSILIKLQQATDIRSRELLINFSHTRPDGTSCDTVLSEVGLNAGAGENIAYGYGTPSAVMEGWMNSPGHRSNILNNRYCNMGIGEINNHWVQMFVSGGESQYAMLLPNNLEVSYGTAVNNLGVTILTYSENYGIGYLPLTAEMVSGYQMNQAGSQNVTVDFSGYEGKFTVTVKQSSSGSGGSSSGGGGGGGSHSSGGSSSGGGGSHSSGSGAAGGSGKGPGGSGTDSLPDYVVKGTWTQAADMNWKFTDSNGVLYVNKWAAIENPYANTASGQSPFDWFFFDANGNMATGWYQDGENLFYLNQNSDGTRGRMVTGWFWIPDRNGVQKCYYFNPNSDGTRGKLIRNSVIDGSTTNANGEWVVNGVVQTK